MKSGVPKSGVSRGAGGCKIKTPRVRGIGRGCFPHQEERSKLRQRGRGRSPSRKRVLAHFELET